MSARQDKRTKRIRSRKAQDLIRIIEEIRADPEAMKQVRRLIAAT